jgi:hypothetical protein
MGTPIDTSPASSCWMKKSDTSLGMFIQATLAAFSAPITYENVVGMTAWAFCEGPPGSQGQYNPWNTTWPGGQQYGNQGGVNVKGPLGGNPQQNGGNPVKDYVGWADGVLATVKTMNNTGIPGVLKSGSSADAIAQAVGSARWGTSPACIQSKIGTYQSNPTQLCADLNTSVNSGGTNQGGSGATADAGAAVPINGPSFGSLIGGLGKLLSTITSVAFWKRLGQGAAGVALVLIGALFILSETKAGQAVERGAAEGAVLA